VAREYGIPCVVNVQGFIAALEDGDLIEVDGTSGIVKIKSD
jgi:pyruvate,water dikinase